MIERDTQRPNADELTREAFARRDLAALGAIGAALTLPRIARGSGDRQQTTLDSPPGTVVIAQIPGLFEPGRTVEMTYYKTEAGARVFAAGVLTLGIRALQDDVSQLLENVWTRLTAP